LALLGLGLGVRSWSRRRSPFSRFTHLTLVRGPTLDAGSRLLRTAPPRHRPSARRRRTRRPPHRSGYARGQCARCTGQCRLRPRGVICMCAIPGGDEPPPQGGPSSAEGGSLASIVDERPARRGRSGTQVASLLIFAAREERMIVPLRSTRPRERGLAGRQHTRTRHRPPRPSCGRHQREERTDRAGRASQQTIKNPTSARSNLVAAFRTLMSVILDAVTRRTASGGVFFERGVPRQRGSVSIQSQRGALFSDATSPIFARRSGDPRGYFRNPG
jgi:hypothetical protein